MAKIAVAPLVGAWIEIKFLFVDDMIGGSLPSWERGLKLKDTGYDKPAIVSLPSWERGLKSA